MEGPEADKIRQGGLGGFPNGNYKVTLGWFDDLDDKIGVLTFFHESLFHSKILDGKDF
jgi:hypothetical protein